MCFIFGCQFSCELTCKNCSQAIIRFTDAHVNAKGALCMCIAVCYSVVWCVAVWCSVLQCVAVWSRVLQCVAVCCSVLQCVAVCCSVLQ